MTILINFTIPNFECFIIADRNKFVQVIRNLISNALKFCRKPGAIKVDADVVLACTYPDLQSKNRSKKRFMFPTRNLKKKSSLQDETGCTDYYWRLSVTDDGVGISEVRFNPYVCILLYLNIICCGLGKSSQVISRNHSI